MKRSRWMLLVGLVLLIGCVAQPASAYRKPHKRERTRITKAFHKHHRHWRKQHLKIQGIRVSSARRHFAMVIFAKASHGHYFTVSKTDFFRGHRKKRGHRHGQVVASDIVDDVFDFLPKFKVPKDVKNDVDPRYTVTYLTLSYEHVDTRFQEACGAGRYYTSSGRYAWSAKWRGVQLTLPSFQARSAGEENSISGHYTFSSCKSKCDTDVKTLNKAASFANLPDLKGTTLFVTAPAYGFANCNSLQSQGAFPSAVAVTRVPLADVKQAGDAVFRQPLTQSNLADRGGNCAPNRSLPCKRTIKLQAEIDYEKEG